MAAPIAALTTFSFNFPSAVKLDRLDGTNWQSWNNTLTMLMCMNGCHCHLTHSDPAHANPATPYANVVELWNQQEEVIIGLLTLYTTSGVCNQVSSDTVYPTVHDKYQHLETLYENSQQYGHLQCVGWPGVMICPDCLLTSYDYGLKGCHYSLVMDSIISQCWNHMYDT